ncbi:hypothetical protein [Nostoc sp. MS1]|nr:hypothetical protein [Nostoc sp. MS1]
MWFDYAGVSTSLNSRVVETQLSRSRDSPAGGGGKLGNKENCLL